MMLDGVAPPSRAIVHVVGDPEDVGLEGVAGEYRDVALRLRRLVRALDLNQDSFAKATAAEGETGLRRTEINVAWNGGQLAKTSRWIAGVAHAAKVSRDVADGYLRGRVPLEDLMRHRMLDALPPAPVLDLESVAPPNLADTLKRYEWRPETTLELKELVAIQAAQHWRVGGVDFAPDIWERTVAGLERDALGLHSKRVKLLRPLPTFEMNEPDPDIAAEIAARRAKKTGRKRR